MSARFRSERAPFFGLVVGSLLSREVAGRCAGGRAGLAKYGALWGSVLRQTKARYVVVCHALCIRWPTLAIHVGMAVMNTAPRFNEHIRDSAKRVHFHRRGCTVAVDALERSDFFCSGKYGEWL